MSFAALKKEIKSHRFHRLYLLWGDESYLKNRVCADIAHAAVAAGTEGFNLHRFYGDSFDLRRFAGAVTNLPLMSDWKCVVVRDLTPKSVDKSSWNQFRKLLAEIPEGCIVVLCYDAASPGKKDGWFVTLEKLARKVGVSEQLSRPAPAQLERWAYRHVTENGGSIAPACLRYLIDYTGGDMNTLAGEIDKLTALAGGREITRADIDGFCTRTLSDSIFELSRAVLSGNAVRAYRVLDELLERREEPVLLLATLSTAFCDLYRAKVGRAAGAGQAEIAKAFGYRAEFRVRYALRDSRSLPMGYLEHCLDALTEADLRLKGSGIDHRVVLEQLLASLLEPRRGARA